MTRRNTASKTNPAPRAGAARRKGPVKAAWATGDEALEHSEEKFRSVVAAMAEGVVLHRPDGTIIDCNPQAARILRLTRDQILGRTSRDPRWQAVREDGSPFPGEEHPAMVTLRTGQPCRQIVMGLHLPEGVFRWININAEPLFQPGAPGPHGAVVTFSDITEHKHAEEALRKSEERFRAITDFSPDIISIFDGEGRLVFNSAAAKKIHGYQAGELERRSTFDFIHPDDRPAVTNAFGQLLKTPDAVVNVQYRYRNADGSYKWMEAFGRNELTNPHIHGIIAISRDISERKRSEAALARSHDQYRRAIIAANAIPYEKNYGADAYVFMAEGIKDLTGYAPAELRSACWKKIVLETVYLGDAAGLSAAEVIRRVLDGDLKHWQADHRIRTRSGAIRWLSDASIAMRDAAGKYIGSIGIIHDITERKQAEAALRRAHDELELRVLARTAELNQINIALRTSEERFRAIANHTPDHILIQDLNLRYRLVINPQLGLTEADMLGKTDRDLFRKADAANMTAIKKTVLTTGKPVHVEMPFPNLMGDLEFFEGDYIPKRAASGKVDGLIGYFRNVTERKRAEEALRQKEEHLRSVVSAVPIALWDLDSKGTILLSEGTAIAKLGLKPKEGIGQSAFKRHRTSPDALTLIRRGLAGEEFSAEVQAGGRLWSNQYVPRRDEKGKVIGLVGISLDITERHQAEEALRKSEERYRVLFTHSRDALMTLEPPAWSFTSGNPSAVEMFHAGSVNQLLAAPPWELAPEFQPDGRPSREAAQAMIDLAMRQGSHSFQWRHRRLNGEVFPAAVLLTRVEISGHVLLQATVRDITERARLEEEILNISERESRRIAQDLHDGLGQLLVGANYLTSSLRKDLAEKPVAAAQRVARIQEVINEAIALTRNLARGAQPVKPEPNGLTVALAKLAEQTKEVFRIRCDFKCRPPVLIEDNKVATHLFRLAQEAVTNAIKHGRSKRILIRLTRTTDLIKLAVTDDGVGIPTRQPKKAGMGLNIMRYRAGIIGGSLSIQKRAAGGTAVLCSVHFPPNRK